MRITSDREEMGQVSASIVAYGSEIIRKEGTITILDKLLPTENDFLEKDGGRCELLSVSPTDVVANRSGSGPGNKGRAGKMVRRTFSAIRSVIGGCNDSIQICRHQGKARLSIVAVFLATLCLTSLGQGSTGTLGQIKVRGELHVGIKTTSTPFGFIGEHGENKGLDVDIAKWLSKDLFGNADAVKFVPVTPRNEIDLLNAGKIDIIAGMTITEERRKKVDFSVPYFVTGHLILVRSKEKPFAYHDLSGKKVAIVAGSASDTVVRASGATSVRFNTIAEAVRALKEGQVDAVVSKDEILFEVEKGNPELSMANWHPFAVEHYGLAVRRGDNEWLSFANDSLTTMKKTSDYRQLLEKWFGMARALLYERMLSVPSTPIQGRR